MSKILMEPSSTSALPRVRSQEPNNLNAMAYALQQQQQQQQPQQLWFTRNTSNQPVTQATAAQMQNAQVSSQNPLLFQGAFQNAALMNLATNPYAAFAASGLPFMPPFGGASWPLFGLPGYLNPQLLQAQLAAVSAGLPVMQNQGTSLQSTSMPSVLKVPTAIPAMNSTHQISARPKTVSPLHTKIEAISDHDDVRLPVISSSGKHCSSCGTNNTPVWREVEHVTLCNACGIRWRRTGLACAACKYVPRAHQIRQKSCSRCGKASKFLPCMTTSGSSVKKARRVPDSPQPRKVPRSELPARPEPTSEDEEDEQISAELSDDILEDNNSDDDDEYAPPRGGRNPGSHDSPQTSAAITVASLSSADLSPAELEATDVLKANFSNSSLQMLASVAE